MNMDKILVTLDDLLIGKINIKLDEEIKSLIKTKVEALLKLNKIPNRKEIVSLLYRLKTCNFIRGDNVKKLLISADIPSNLVESHVIAIRRGHCGYNKPLKVILPIKPTKELALLVAKTMGDGGIASDLRFHYTNKDYRLITEVIEAVSECVGETDYKIWGRRGLYEFKFPSVVGFLLAFSGSPIGIKVKNPFKIPDWILAGSNEIKSNFLRGLFDDEACVDFRNYTRRIVFAMGKNEKYKQALIDMLNSIKMLLMGFGINAGEIYFQEKVKGNIMLRFAICRLENFNKFHKLIGFNHSEKKDVLERICASYKDIHKTRNIILNLINHSTKRLTTKEISSVTGFKHGNTEAHLTNLQREGKVSKSFDRNKNLWGSMG